MSTKRSIIRTDLADAIHDSVGLPRAECGDLVNQVFDVIIDALATGDSVKISKFGTFTIIDKEERIGRNPRTGKEAVITARKVISFKQSRILKRKVESRIADIG